MAYPTLALKFSPTTDRFDTPSYVTIPASHVEGVDIQTGRQSELDGVSPGTFTADLDGSSRIYDPSYAAGAYYGGLTPGKRMQFLASYDETAGATTISYVGIGALASGNNVSLTPALPGGWVEFDLLLILASIRNSGTGTVNVPDGWTALLTSGNVCLLGRIARTGDTVEVARNTPTVTFSGGVANATTLAQCVAFRGTERDITLAVDSSVAQLNGSAANVAVPSHVASSDNVTMVLAIWKQAAWTSAAQLSGQFFTEISDSPSTLGDDASHQVQYRLGGGVNFKTFTGTSVTITGGAAAISRSMVVALRPYSGTTYELFNGWTDGWVNAFAARLGRARMKASGPFGILAKTTAPDPYTAAVEADSPTAWYRLNEGSGTVLTDSSGNGLHGRWIPELAEVSTTGALIASDDKAITLPAAPAYATGKIPKTAVPSLAPVSVECWVLLDKVPSDLAGQFWSGILDRGGVSLIVYNETDTYPGSMAFVVHTDDSSGSPASYAFGDTLFYSGASSYWFHTPCDGRPHHIVGTLNAAGDFLCIWIDGIDRCSFNDISGPALTGEAAWADIDINFAGSWNGTAVLDELAFYDVELSSAQIAAHYAAGAMPWRGDTTGERIGRVLDLIGWPADLRDLDGGQTQLGVTDVGGQKALGYLDVVATTEQGLLTEAHDDGGAVRFIDRTARLVDNRSTQVQTLFSDQTADLASSAVAYSQIELANDDRPAGNVVTVSWLGGDVTVRDQASVDAYGEIPASLDTILESQAEATNLAEFVLLEQAALFTRIRSITIRPSGMSGTAAARAFVACLARREGDRVRVVHQPAWTGATIDQHLWIIGREHHLANGVEEWSTTFYFGPAITTAYWILGTSQLDSTTRLSY